jgi:hypothetical protein
MCSISTSNPSSSFISRLAAPEAVSPALILPPGKTKYCFPKRCLQSAQFYHFEEDAAALGFIRKNPLAH